MVLNIVLVEDLIIWVYFLALKFYYFKNSIVQIFLDMHEEL